jgi:hypothetical protein
MLEIHKKDNANIIVFITHHTKNKKILDDILFNAKSTFKKYTEATLEKKEIKFIDGAVKEFKVLSVSDKDHNPKLARDNELKTKDREQSSIERIEGETDNESPLLIEIRKSAKSMEIIGQIMKNQYGSLKKDELVKLFENGQNVGLRLLKSFICLMNEYPDGLYEIVQEKINAIQKEKKKVMSKEEIDIVAKQFANMFSYGIVFGWIHKIVDSLGYDKLIEIADKVNSKTDSVASKLINLSIHIWYTKKLDIGKLKTLLREFSNNKNHAAQYMLKDIVSRHIYMHKMNYKEKQKIDALLGFSVQKQLGIQSRLPNKP